jgi:hypothetical protein
MKKYVPSILMMLTLIAFSGLTYAQTDVNLHLIDSSKTLTTIKAKGSFDGWASLVDMTKNDGDEANIFTATVSVTDGSYEWGAIQDDNSENGIWMPSLAGFGSNPTFTVAGTSITGDTAIIIKPVDPVDVVVAVDMSFEISKGGFDVTTDSVGLAGPVNDWSYTKLTKGATDSVYTGTFQWGNYFEYKFRKNDQWEGSPNRGVYLDGKTDPVELDTVWYSNISPAPSVTVICYVIDGTEYYEGLQYKGEITGWSNVPMYDDGTNGDVTAGDHIWTVTLEDVTAGQDYKWGAVDKDDNWLIQGSDRVVSVAMDGSTTGETYEIPAWGDVAVTFMVNMNCHINLGVFDVDTSCMDVNIDGYPPVEMTHLDTGVFAVTVTRFSVDDVLAYTYRMNCSFDGDYVEYPGNDNNRTYTVVAGENTTGVELYQDDVLDAPCNYEDPNVSVANSIANRVQVYPNPAYDELQITSEFEIETVNLYSITGRNMKTMNGNYSLSKYLDLNDLNSGIYILQIKGAQGENVFKKIVKN